MRSAADQRMTASRDLSGLLSPKSIALVGASDRSAFSRAAFKNLQELGYTGAVHLVNRNGGLAHGLQTHVNCQAIGQPIDAALLMVPVTSIVDTLHDLRAAGVSNAVILAGGFAELGEEGRKMQNLVAQTAAALGITVLGPNCLGFINFHMRVACWTGSMRTPALAGPVSVVSQSGAVATFIKHFAHQQGIGLHCVVSTGNEATLDLATVADYLIDDPANRVIALFIETVRDSTCFKAMAARALKMGKALVVLKVGRSELSVQTAQSHTGAMVGDDRVFDGVCRQYGIVRVQSIEELAFTADLISKLGPLSGDGLALVSYSGGMAGLSADYADMQGIRLPKFADDTLGELRQALPAYATPANPLDITGGAIGDASLFRKALQAISGDPGVSLIACIADVPTGLSEDWAPPFVAAVEEIGRYMEGARKPTVVLSNSTKYVSEQARVLACRTGISYVATGLDMGMRAIRHLFDWSRKRKRSLNLTTTEASAISAGHRPTSERETTAFLASQGVPVVPSVLAKNVRSAIAAAQSFGVPVAMKIASSEIAHKTEVGGVKLKVSGDGAVREAFEAIQTSVRQAAPTAAIDGVLMSPMRIDGIELFVGVRQDPQWGHVLALGLGGVWIEALQDMSLRLLPVNIAEVIEMLGELRGARLLAGYRGQPPADLEAVAACVARIGDAALALGPELDTLEVNPLWVAGPCVEVLDSLATYRTAC